MVKTKRTYKNIYKIKDINNIQKYIDIEDKYVEDIKYILRFERNSFNKYDALNNILPNIVSYDKKRLRKTRKKKDVIMDFKKKKNNKILNKKIISNWDNDNEELDQPKGRLGPEQAKAAGIGKDN